MALLVVTRVQRIARALRGDIHAGRFDARIEHTANQRRTPPVAALVLADPVFGFGAGKFASDGWSGRRHAQSANLDAAQPRNQPI